MRMVKKVITGNGASANGARLAKPKVIAAYPITPQTSIIEKLALMVSNGELDAKFIKVESEHSAMAACIAAQNTGVRTYTASSSHGLALMHELLMWASGARLPIVMTDVNRAMGPPWSIWADQQDTIAQRDTGWIQFYVASNQEALDTIIQAYKVAETVNLPAMSIEDAFILSHTMESVDIPEQETVDSFLPAYEPKFRLKVGEPRGFGSLVMPEGYMEFRYKISEAMDEARNVIRAVGKEFGETFGREYGLVEEYKTDDAEVVLVIAGSVASTAMEVVDMMRDEGKKAGVLRIRSFRPFPYEEIRKVAKQAGLIGVFDRSYTGGFGGAIGTEVKGALYNSDSSLPVKNYIAGLGGRDITPKVLRKIFEDMFKSLNGGIKKEVEWVGLRDGSGRW